VRTIHISVGNPDYRRTPKTAYFCINCQKDINPSRPHRMVHIIGGGDTILHPADESLYTNQEGDCGAHPIGNDCAKRFGLEWSVPVAAKP